MIKQFINLFLISSLPLLSTICHAQENKHDFIKFKIDGEGEMKSMVVQPYITFDQDFHSLVKKERLNGKIHLSFFINEQCQLDSVRVDNGLTPEIDQKTLEALKDIDIIVYENETFVNGCSHNELRKLSFYIKVTN